MGTFYLLKIIKSLCHHMCQRLVKFKIRLISLIIHFFILRFWLVATCFFYRDGNSFIIIFVKSDSDTGKECGSKRCCCIGCRYNDRFARDIGFDLCPEKRR